VSPCDHGSLKFSFKPLPPIAGPEDCTATHVVALDAVLSADGRRITLSPTAALRCPMAEAVTHWIREDVAPTTWLLQCRCTVLRLSIPLPAGGVTVSRMQRISKDGLANALDVRAFKLTNGAAI